jgi:release factor glutamine methyltransferase
LSNKLSYYKNLTNRLSIENEFNFFLKIKLHLNDEDIHINKDRILSKKEQNLIEDFFLNAEKGIPLDYILNSSEFFENDFYVDSRVLIPRPESEILVDYVNKNFTSSIKVLDAGTGSGCIGISIALKNLDFDVYGSDYSNESLSVATINKKFLKAKNYYLINADWLSCFKEKSFDVIVSNPPYIDKDDKHMKDLKHEPYNALVAKDGGLGAIKEIVSQSSLVLKKKGVLIIEHGYNQKTQVENIFKKNHFSNIENIMDFSSIPRITIGTLKI